MQEEEYIIINKTATQKRIEELEKQFKTPHIGNINRVEELKQILSQSTPLIPEIEKGVKKGLSICLTKKDWAYGISGSVKQDIREYISNLKLNI